MVRTFSSGCRSLGPLILPSLLLFPWELAPIVLACAIGGPHWRGQLVLSHSDNMAVVTKVNRLHARNPKATHMLRGLAFSRLCKITCSEQSIFQVSRTLEWTICLMAERQHSMSVSPRHLLFPHTSFRSSSVSSAIVLQTGPPCIGEICSVPFGGRAF